MNITHSRPWKLFRRRATHLTICLVLSGLLTSCIGAVVVGAAGSVMVYDRRSLTMIEKDARIFYVINRAITNERGFRNSHITVTSYSQVVLLTGQATSDALRLRAEKIAQSTPGIRRVYNEITVGEPLLLSERSKDALITSEIRTKMLAEPGLESGSIRIITEQSNVYLMGIATHEQADLAVNVARHSRGVNKVIKIFQYIV
jgi:osmotically-inducible protein OsmY